MSTRWDEHFLQLCLDHARMSKDPSTKVGAVIVGPDREIRSAGFNGFPRGIEDNEERLNNREEKYKLIVHAEENSILGAARVGIPLKGCTLYVVAKRQDKIWGGAPCIRCAVSIVQAGITNVVVPLPLNLPVEWQQSCEQGKAVLKEAGINYREISFKELSDTFKQGV